MKEAIERGARAIVTEDIDLEVPSTIEKVCVEDKKVLAKFSKRYYGNPDEYLDLIGVTEQAKQL